MQLSRIALLAVPALMAGCSQVEGFFGAGQSDPGPSAAAPAESAAPAATGGPVRPPANAVTADDFDTSTDAERQAAAAPAQGGDAELGQVVVSLGAAAEPGFWLETPLVDAVTPGRVELANGESAQVELRPAPAGSGSRLSLPAMRLLNIPLTDLPEVTVYRSEGSA
ncbi:hypothetical protein SAMN05421853_102343 [Roseivivax halotolerans]|jgi:hypothetical protein|uniref:D-galactarate dehydratase n=1 Tax=Roseivivax halotolerans TaxID=93684 RepID=A0A1I5WH05_9RHOB|nr:hypothetical protein [Roseivivax halotolerans]SFQ18965.1 hypothetical protein SAMN05421853_102343 [Roseivivax halotolerans]